MKDQQPVPGILNLDRTLFARFARYTFALMSILSALQFLACKTSENRPVSVPSGFDWQGHRGCRGLMPENTVPAFLKALDYPEVLTLELDLAVSKDNQLIVSHEPWFNPEICLLPNGDTMRQRDSVKFLIYRMGLHAIRGLDCGSKGNPRFPEQQKMKVYKPTLLEVFSAVLPIRPNIRWNIEIKSRPEWDGVRHPPVEEFVRLVVAEISQLGLEKSVTIQSFDIRALQALHRQAPHIKLAYLIENVQSLEANIEKLGFKPDVYSPYYLLVDKALVAKCHKQNIQLVPWTVNDVKSMRRLIRLGVDGIITDYPNRIKEVGK